MTISKSHVQTHVQALSEAISNDAFTEWYRNRQIKQNMRDGQPWRHTPASISPPARHSPHKLLQCQRKTYYKTQNTPKEDSPPDGIFWAGTRIEEDLVMPFLEDVAAETEPRAYVQNSMWIDYEIETEAKPIHIKGATDPVICTQDGDPILPTEIKTKQSLDAGDGKEVEPAERHRAQLHAYLHGLDENTSYTVDTGLVIYVDRKQHDLVATRVDFDVEFWEETVLEWATAQTQYRLDETLPPAEPEAGWECQYCSFRQRCGKADSAVVDSPADGFVPLTEYPRAQVEKALNAEGGATALTPTLGRQHPELSERYPVTDWQCSVCGQTTEREAVDWDGNTNDPPACPHCATKNRFAPLQGQSPAISQSNP
jgi:CRISPR/Cas system-associated exonuclease Cas4 (RecB family)